MNAFLAVKKSTIVTVAIATASFAMAQVSQSGAAGSVTSQPGAAEPVIQLSPFIVTEEDDGYVATSSLAGSRLNTPLRDTAASISVLTSEFLADLGAVGFEDALGYAVNVHFEANEGAGNDNWAMGGYDAQRVRIRGVSATVTRNYFKWNIQSDTYNADRIEENRGPNSILFGLGSAGGVVNTMTKRAQTGRNFRRASVVIGSYDSYRGSLDVNHRLLDDRLAMRVNAVWSEQGNYRQHTFNDTRRIHLASTWQATPRTQLRLDYEIGKIENVGMRPAPAFTGINNWVDAGSPILQTVQTTGLGAASGITRYAAGARRLTFVENLGVVYNYQGQNRSSGNIGVILDPSLVDYSVNPTGPYNRRDSDLQNLSIFLEQKIGERTFAELSYNTQGIDRTTHQSGQGRTENAQLFADPHRFLPDGSPNPFAGALFFEGGRWNYINNDQTTHNTRLILSHEFEFGKWGNYRLAGLGEYERRSEANRNWVEAWEGSPFGNQPENDQNQVWRRYYATPGVWSTYHSGSGPYNGNFLQNVPDPTTPGRFLNSTWVPFNQGGMRDAYEKQRTVLVGGHARYFDRRLVLGVGLRKDKLSVRTLQSDRDPRTNEWSLDLPGLEFQREDYSGTTRTLGAVGHVTPKISLFYNRSNSLDVPNTSHRILPDGRIPPNSDATGQDYGIGFSLFNGRMSARVNRFEVDMVGATGGGFGGTADNPTVLNERILDALLGAGVITPRESDARRFITNNATIDRRVEGYELSVNGSVTPNWRLTLSYSYTDGFDSNIGPEVKAWAAENIPWYLQWSNVQTGVTGPGGDLMTVAEVVEQWQADVQRLRWVREGDLLLGNRKHKYSIFTRYTFSSGPLKKLYVGAGYRYQSAPPIGFDQDEMLQWGRSQDNVDALLGYRIQGKWGFLKKGVSLQLNVRNVLNKTEPFITSLAADNVRITRALIVEPRSWRLTANFEF